MENDGINGQKGGSAQQFTEGIDQLCDLIISRLEEKWNRVPALLGHFLLAKKVEGRSPRTLEWYQEALGAFKRFCSCQGFDPDPTQVTPLHISM